MAERKFGDDLLYDGVGSHFYVDEQRGFVYQVTSRRHDTFEVNMFQPSGVFIGHTSRGFQACLDDLRASRTVVDTIFKGTGKHL